MNFLLRFFNQGIYRRVIRELKKRIRATEQEYLAYCKKVDEKFKVDCEKLIRDVKLSKDEYADKIVRELLK